METAENEERKRDVLRFLSVFEISSYDRSQLLGSLCMIFLAFHVFSLTNL